VKGALFLIFVTVLLSIALAACRVRITPLPPPIDPAKLEKVCQAPPIEVNIIGTWNAGIKNTIIGDTVSRLAPITTASFAKVGSLTFYDHNRVADPDFLLPNRKDLADRGPLVYFQYDIASDHTHNGAYNGMGLLFWIWQYYQKSRTEIVRGAGYYHTVITNECNRIHLRGDALEIVLVRMK
jgi:hypothetical protein